MSKHSFTSISLLAAWFGLGIAGAAWLPPPREPAAGSRFLSPHAAQQASPPGQHDQPGRHDGQGLTLQPDALRTPASGPRQAARPRVRTPSQTARAKKPDTAQSHALQSGDEGAEQQPDQAHARRLPLFENWPKPELLLVATGDQLGYIEPCGCTGRENQKGGIMRRFSFLKELRARGWPVLAVDVGGQVKRYGRQAELKFQASVQALRAMRYAACGWGTEDVKLSAGELAAAVAEVDGERLFVSANVGLFAWSDEIVPRYRVVQVGRKRVGITSVLLESEQEKVNNSEVVFRSAAEGLDEVLPELKRQRCDLLVLLSYGPPQETAALAARYRDFQVVVTSGGADEPPLQAQQLRQTGQFLIEVGHKGMYAVAIGWYADPKVPLRYQVVPLDARFADAPEMQQVLAAYQYQLRQEGWAGLGLQPALHPRAKKPSDLLGQFAGSQACGDCHTRAYEKWQSTPHAHATQTLAELDPPRLHDPECVSCHVTGWVPQKYNPYHGGFHSLEKTPLLAGNGCENCHGPGRAHIAAENGTDEALQMRLRTAMRVSRESARDRLCVQCHDEDNDPGYNPEAFDTHYWPEIEHPWRD